MKYVILFLFLIACGTAKKNSSTPAKPLWLQATPVDPGYYTGIGHSLKYGNYNYIQAAKKSALDDIISEIKVIVQSSTTLSQLDINKEFQEQYEQIIKTTATDELEEFEQVDAWEDQQNYWVYFRLSKARYKQIKEEKKRNAMTLGLDFFTKARLADQSGDLVTSLSYYYQGFRAVEKYLGDPIRVEYQGQEILLTNEIIRGMQQMMNKIDLSATPGEISVNRRIIKSNLQVVVRAKVRGTNKAIAALPLQAVFEKGSGNALARFKSDEKGLAKVLITQITSRDAEQQIAISANPNAFEANDSSAVFSLIAEKLVIPKAGVLLHVQRPLVYITSSEKSLGQLKTSKEITDAVTNFLTQSGFEITARREKAELSVDISADTQKGVQSGSVFITYLTGNIRVQSLPDGKEIYTSSLNRIKGYSLDFDRSSQQAYTEGLKVLTKDNLPKILTYITQ